MASETKIGERPTACKHGEVGCGVYYDCGKCSWARKKEIWRKMTPKQRAYDAYVAPALASALNNEAWAFEPQGCSCHINPPCSFCCSDVDGGEADAIASPEPTP